MVGSSMSTLMSKVGDIFTTAIGWVGEVASTITQEGNEIILLFVLLPLVGLGIGLFKRLMSVN